MRLFDQLLGVWRFRQALWLLSQRDLRQRVNGTLLGAFWLVLQPLFLLLIYIFVFGVIFKVRFNAEADTLNFAFYLMAGLLPFSAFQETVNRSTSTLVGNRSLIQRSVFPTEILPVVTVLGSIATELIGLLLLVLVVAIDSGRVSATLWLLPALIAVRILLSLGAAWLTAILAVFIRDLGQLVGTLLTLTFFATPILYPVDMIPENWRWVQVFNPFNHLVSGYRSVLIDGAWPDPALLVLAVFSLGFALLGFAAFSRLVPRAKDFL